MVPSVKHTGELVVPEQVAPVNRSVQEVGGEEATEVVSRGGKGDHLLGVQRL